MAATAERCKRAGCSGLIVDGFCEDCGRPPVGGPSVVNAATAKTKNGGGAANAGVSTRSAKAFTTGGAVGTSGSALSRPGSASVSRTGSGTGTGSGRGSGSVSRNGSRRSTSSSARGSSRRALGAGLVQLEPLPSLDPLQSILANPVVPENKRFCPNCDTKLNHEKGFCPMCGQEYSFRPTINPGDVLAGQYEVKGAMAFGGLGWIYLAWDQMLSRWAVLKGLLNSKDAQSAQAALLERQFLAAVKNANIVGVYNFVNHGAEGYIVMEYVGGKTLKAIRKERGPLPPVEAVAYCHRILAAFAYLHRMGLVYCDFKPDNFMLEDDDVKLIDMGGVRRIDDPGGDVYGTKGYTAPEAYEEPSFVSDLYTVARTLAVLMMDFKFQGQYEFSLPPPQEQPIFAQYESLYRFLLKATRKDPDTRFQTAEEMSDQLLGVLREMVAQDSGTPRPGDSALYLTGGLDLDERDEANWRQLPSLRVDPTDPAANAILAGGGTSDLGQRAAIYAKAVAQFPESAEAPLRLALTRIEQGEWDKAEAMLKQVQEADPFDWQVHWYRGLSLLAQSEDLRGRQEDEGHKGLAQLAQAKAQEAVVAFDRCYSEVPGELGPKLANALAAEEAGDLKTSARLYDVVSRTDPAYTVAIFGLARCLARLGDRAGAVAAYGRVANTSNRYVPAQMALARTLVTSHPTPPSEQELVQASNALTALGLENYETHHLSAQLLLAAARQIEAKAIAANAAVKLLGLGLDSTSLRLGVEREYRACAHFARTLDEKITLVDEANRERPRTLF